tara:strand:+ start:104 stop:997 length:894 start_codon:yes stop_codon:yes gene_type:complete
VAGILDPKQRVLDTIITPNGRAQMATGELKIEFASFTDRQMYYALTGSNGVLEDPGTKIYFEAYSTDSDTIIQELDANANLAPFQTDNFTLYGGNVISGSGNAQQANVRIYADELPLDSIDSLNRQMILGTRNVLKTQIEENFSITPETATFYVSAVDTATTFSTASLDDIESLWQDYRVTGVKNYKFLPPQNQNGQQLGDYTKINVDPPTTYDEVLGKLTNTQVQKFTFSNTRTTNDILGQIFEISEKQLSKLVIIDGGSYTINDGPDPHVFYAGKLYRDTQGALTFINIFTLVFE